MSESRGKCVRSQDSIAKPHLGASPSMVNLWVPAPATFRDTLEGRLGFPTWLWPVKASTPVVGGTQSEI